MVAVATALSCTIACTVSVSPPQMPLLSPGQRLVEREGRQLIEEGIESDLHRVGTWRYFDPDTREVRVEVDYEAGIEVRSRLWVLKRLVYETAGHPP